MERKIRTALWVTALVLTLLCAGRIALAWQCIGQPDHRLNLDHWSYQTGACA